MTYYVGQRVKVGGRYGAVYTINSINGDDFVLVSDNGLSIFYYHKGDCVLLPLVEKIFEQLTLF